MSYDRNMWQQEQEKQNCCVDGPMIALLTAKIPAKWSGYPIPSLIVVFVILVFELKFVSFIPESHKGLEPIIYRAMALFVLCSA
jgi:hypothetical protein